MKYFDRMHLRRDGGAYFTPCCNVGLGEQPHMPVFCNCPRRDVGLGDTIARTLRRIGIKKRKGCGCTKRQQALNNWFPYRLNDKR